MTDDMKNLLTNSCYEFCGNKLGTFFVGKPAQPSHDLTEHKNGPLNIMLPLLARNVSTKTSRIKKLDFCKIGEI